MSRPPFSLAQVDAATSMVLAAGGPRVLQTHRYGATDERHVAVLASYLLPLPPAAMIVDAGCGLGEVSRILSRVLPHATFVLVNLSDFQLSNCPQGEQFIHMRADWHEVPLHAGMADAVMFSSALCQMDAPVALRQAQRVLKIGGVLLLNEMMYARDDIHKTDVLERHLAARVAESRDMAHWLAQAGFRIDRMDTPEHDDGHFRGLLRQAGIEFALDGVLPCVIRAIRVA